MPKIETWGNIPVGVGQHLIERMLDREIGIADLNRLRLWIDANSEVPEGDWFAAARLLRAHKPFFARNSTRSTQRIE